MQFAVLLAVVGVATWWLAHSVFLTHAWVAAAEALLSAFFLGATAVEHPQLLPYLLAPPLIAGLSGGVFPLLLAVAGQSLGTVLLTSDRFSLDAVVDRAEFFAPWLVISLGIGLLGAWLREIGLGPTTPSLDRSYESARRLVGQLRSVARRLSSGLDPITIASRLQNVLVDELGVQRIAIFVRTEGGVLSPLVYHGDDARGCLSHEDPLVMQCWTEVEPVYVEAHKCVRRFALPLRVGSRMVGVVLLDGPVTHGHQRHIAERVMREVDDVALRLETALAFDEVRALATVEERSRLAREIHDGIAQEIASLGYLVDDLRSESDHSSMQERLADLRAELTRVVNELRLSIFDLRTGVGTGVSLGTALSDYVQQVGARSNMTVHLTLDEAPTRLRTEVETELLRIVQEAVTNARKHASAENLWVDCRVHPPFASVRVRDDGTGLGSARADSYGLRIMQERAARIDAVIDISDNGETGSGTVVTVNVGA